MATRTRCENANGITGSAVGLEVFLATCLVLCDTGNLTGDTGLASSDIGNAER